MSFYDNQSRGCDRNDLRARLRRRFERQVVRKFETRKPKVLNKFQKHNNNSNHELVGKGRRFDCGGRVRDFSSQVAAASSRKSKVEPRSSLQQVETHRFDQKVEILCSPFCKYDT